MSSEDGSDDEIAFRASDLIKKESKKSTGTTTTTGGTTTSLSSQGGAAAVQSAKFTTSTTSAAASSEEELPEGKEVSEVIGGGPRASKRLKMDKSVVEETLWRARRREELESMEHKPYGMSSPLIQIARKLQVKEYKNYFARDAKSVLIEKILEREEELNALKAHKEAQNSLSKTTFANLEEILRKPQRQALEDGTTNPFMRENWHLCFCYVQVVWGLAASSYATFCDEYFEPVMQLGAKIHLTPAATALLSNLTVVTIPTDTTMTFKELTQREAFQQEFPGYNKGEWEASFQDRMMPESPKFVRLNPIEGLFSRGLIDGLPNTIAGMTKPRTTGSRVGNLTLRDKTNLSLNQHGVAELAEDVPLYLLHHQSAILKHLHNHSTAGKFNDFDGESAQCLCIRNEQGKDLEQSRFVFIMDGKESPTFFSTDQRYLFKENEDRFTEALLLEPFFKAFVGSRDGDGLIGHAVHDVSNLELEVAYAINFYALMRLDNDYRRDEGMEPLVLKPFNDHPALCDQNKECMEKRIASRTDLLRVWFKRDEWQIKDIHRREIIRNAFNPNSKVSAWVFCTKGILG
ncbi:hypothetical protein TrCOL_g10765 [Triparma columacea]|uniref:Uncharacterized protein n=1 Tax=Triparma columacea TaxID=722753 RepID=A0A9W7LG50_9STRA|nr:hypothetical protein TrCOL_g10765 [Triparma columacea]